MSRLRTGLPLWLDRPHSRVERYPSCRGGHDVDVAIVGGGITGASVAVVFADAGVRVAVLERARVGRGSTAASTALLMQETDKDFRELEAKYGWRAARRIWELSRFATRDLVRTVRRLEIDCDLVELDSVYYTTDPDAVSNLRDEYRRRERAGFDGRWLDPNRLRRDTGIAGAAAIRTHGNAQLDPYRACLGLVKTAIARGADVFERSPVTRVVRNGSGVLVSTRSGRIRARRVIIATGYATPKFKALNARFRMMRTYVVATEKADARVRRALGLGNVMLWDTGRPYHYARWTEDGRLLLGGEDRPHVKGSRGAPTLAEGRKALRAYFEKLYPALSAVKTGYAWEGLFAMTSDGLPYIGPHRLYPGHLFALGYGGNGMTFGFLAARQLLQQYRGESSSDHDLFAFNR